MPRPKGSKNKQPTDELDKLELDIKAEQKTKAALEQKETKLVAEIAERKDRLTTTRQEIKASAKRLASLETARDELKAARVYAAQQEEFQSIMNNAIRSGLSMEDIRSRLSV